VVFPLFLSVLPSSVSLILVESLSISDPIVGVSFLITLILAHRPLFFHSLDTNLFFSRALFLL